MEAVMARIIGLVKRVTNRSKSSAFYSLLGLKTKAHQHGGPIHDEVTPVSTEFVIETYPRSDRFNSDALMIVVDDLKQLLIQLKQNGVIPHFTLSDGQSVYVKDPEGNDVMLIQCTPT